LAGPDEEEEEEDGKGRKSWRRERLEYVETATKKHLENVRGLELGKDGEVRDGEWDGGGRSLATGEVESLERAVGLLGGSREQDKMDES
jgi:kinetochore protein Mis12/MTW1